MNIDISQMQKNKCIFVSNRYGYKLDSVSINIIVGYKIPPAEVLHRITGPANKADLKRKSPPGLPRELGFILDANNFSYRAAPPGLLREPDSADNSNRK